MVTIEIKRFHESTEDTLGLLFVNDVFECFTLEDQFQAVKVMHETRIPEGSYDVKLRAFGGHHERYAKKFPGIHIGMLQIMDVPGFTDILFHIGNEDKDTSGCVLLADSVRHKAVGRSRLEDSTSGYLRFYVKIAKAIFTSGYLRFYVKIAKALQEGQSVKLFVYGR